MNMQWPQAKTEELLQAILQELKTAKMQNQRLWSLDDIAAYLNKSKVTVGQRITCKPDFPRPVKIPTSAGKLGPLWYPEQVKAFVKKHQMK